MHKQWPTTTSYISIENLVKYPENCFFLPPLPYSAASGVYCWTTYS